MKHSQNVKCDQSVKDFLQHSVWFVKQVFCVSCFTLFRKVRFLYETPEEFCEILSRVDCKKENYTKMREVCRDHFVQFSYLHHSLENVHET